MAKRRKNYQEEEQDYQEVINHFQPNQPILEKYKIELKPKSENQKIFLDLISNKEIVICSGPAGTGKTLLAVEKGIEFFERKLFNKIIITRPAVSVDEEHGFLPGTLEEKMDPWVRPIMDVFKEHDNK